MPPEAPQPRLIVVASSLSTNSSASRPDGRHALVEDRLDDAIADAVDVGMAEGVREADHHQADQRHADDVLGVDVSRQLGKAVLHEHQKPNEGPGGDAAERAERGERDRRLDAESAGGRKD